MLNRVIIDDTISKEENVASILKLAQSICDGVSTHKQSLLPKEYVYDYSKPVDELGLDKELIIQLIQDYISQIFKSYNLFYEILEGLSQNQEALRESKSIELKNLSHKNLGVARNLRIDDAQVLLTYLMNNHENLEYLEEYIEALMACAFKLNPSYAYDVLKLKKVKDAL